MRLEHVGRFGFWVPDAPVAAEAALQAAVPILLEDEYQLRELRRAGHWPQWIVDVGGHCGAFGLAAVDLFPGANLLAVEPFAESAHCYRANLGERACQLHLIEAAAAGPGLRGPDRTLRSPAHDGQLAGRALGAVAGRCLPAADPGARAGSQAAWPRRASPAWTCSSSTAKAPRSPSWRIWPRRAG